MGNDMKTLNDYFQEIHCINLDKRTDRWEECLNEFNKHNLKVNRFSAVYGKEVDTIPGLTEGQTGAVLSHKKLIQHAKDNSLENILILEDDVEFDENLNSRFFELIDRVPDDWDMLYFGGNHKANNPYCRGILKKVDDNVFRVTNCLAIHAYAIRKNIYDEALNSFKGRPADDSLVELQYNVNCYIIRPHLAWQRPSYSDIGEIFTHYVGLKEDKAFVEGRPFGVEALKRDDVRDKLDPFWQKIYDKQKESGHHY